MLDSSSGRTKVIDTLKSFADLKPDWNAYGAETIRLDVIESAIALINEMSKAPQAFPISNGTLQLEFIDKRENYLEIEFLDAHNVCVFIDYSDPLNSSKSMQLDLTKAEDKSKLMELVDSFDSI